MNSHLSDSSETSSISATSLNTQNNLPIAAQFSSNNNMNEISSTDYQVEHQDVDANWYRRFFYGRDHPTFIGTIEPYGPVIVSIIHDTYHNVGDIYWYRYIVRKKEVSDHRGVLAGQAYFGEPIWEELLKMIDRNFVPHRLTKFITTPELSKELLNLDESRLQQQYKIGVLYQAPFQVSEEEWFANTTASPEYERFLKLLGTKIELLGWQRFGGGLDTKTGGSGKYSIYDHGTWKDFEIMYHVSTLLPFEDKNKYQITRKRHLGNDVVCIVFQDVPKPFSPFAIRSQFLQVYVIVRPVHLHNGYEAYSVEIMCKEGVPSFGPALPSPPIFYDLISLKKFLVATVINGQNAAWKTLKLSEPFLRARNGMVCDIAKRYTPLVLTPLTPPQSPKKIPRDDIDSTLKRLFIKELKLNGSLPDILQVKSLLDKGANPNIRIPRPKPSREQLRQQSVSSSLTHNSFNSESSENESMYKLPNILFAAIALADDPVYVKLLINYGAETMPRDTRFPNAFVFAARYQRVETMRCLLENVPSLGDPESVDAAIGERGNSKNSVGTKLWEEVKKLKNSFRN
ncbi:20525_t:CDS:2 [Cetraspora pellucida]|uniref:20525_t:CDS:1 n=1 Tax=Cetraspora pellucida TaxID=1433469 RepID=A0A9N9B1Q6_9GLOM|nr:20525_t:CDS:2 [Cetraspora pellucida]